MPTRRENYDGLLPEFTNVNVYLENDGVHWEIEIFGVIISHQKSNFCAKEPNIERNEYTVLSISDVPYDIATMGMDYLLSLCKPSIIDEYKNQDDLYNYFQDKNWFGPKIAPVKGAEYDFVEHPCASIVVEAFNRMGLSFAAIWGSPMQSNYGKIDGLAKSNYIVTEVFLEYNGYTASGAYYSYDEALYLSARALW